MIIFEYIGKRTIGAAFLTTVVLLLLSGTALATHGVLRSSEHPNNTIVLYEDHYGTIILEGIGASVVCNGWTIRMHTLSTECRGSWKCGIKTINVNMGNIIGCNIAGFASEVGTHAGIVLLNSRDIWIWDTTSYLNDIGIFGYNLDPQWGGGGPNRIFDSTIAVNFGNAVELKWVEAVALRDSLIYWNGADGYDAEDSHDCLVEDCFFAENDDHNVEIDRCEAFYFYTNDIYGFAGLEVHTRRDGLQIQDSSECVVVANNIYNNQRDGIRIKDSDDNAVEGNNAIGNDEYDCNLEGGSGNVFYNNYFPGNDNCGNGN